MGVETSYLVVSEQKLLIAQFHVQHAQKSIHSNWIDVDAEENR